MARRHRSTDGRIESIRDFVQRSLFLGQPRQGREEKVREKIPVQKVEHSAEQLATSELVSIYSKLSNGTAEEVLEAHKKLSFLHDFKLKQEMESYKKVTKRQIQNCIEIVPPSNLIQEQTVRANVMKNLNQLCSTMKYNLGDSLVSFVDNVNSYVDSMSNINSGEYNLLLYSLLQKSAKDRLAGVNSPAKLSTEQFLQFLCFYLEPSQSKFDRIKELYRYKPSKNINTIQEMISELVKLADQAFPEYDIRRDEIFFESLKSSVPSTVKAKLSIIFEDHAAMNDGEYPSFNAIILGITPDLTEINIAIKNENKNYSIKKIESHPTQPSQAAQNVQLQTTSQAQKIGCTVCRMKNHETSNCFKNPLSPRFKGTHSCVLCRGEHKTPECILYDDVIPVADPCGFCKNIIGNNFFHPEAKCLIKKKITN